MRQETMNFGRHVLEIDSYENDAEGQACRLQRRISAYFLIQLYWRRYTGPLHLIMLSGMN